MKRKVTAIKSIRNQNISGTRSWDIVFEWEDILSKELCIPIKPIRYPILTALLKKIGIFRLVDSIFIKKNINLQFVTDIPIKDGYYLSHNTIPIIIDFWYDNDNDIEKFINLCRNVPLLIVTNREVFELLKGRNCRFPLAHMGLSLPDKYRLNKETIIKDKKFEFGFIGRIDPFFQRLVEKYSSFHEDFVYVYSKGTSVNREYWTNKGDYLGKDDGRESYVDYLRKTKITCYSTPGADESKKVKYNQVTPRVLEMLSNGCMVIGHYPDSADVRWYKLETIVPRVRNYEEFEMCLNNLRRTCFDFNKVSAFLDSHYTSKRANELVSILKSNRLL